VSDRIGQMHAHTRATSAVRMFLRRYRRADARARQTVATKRAPGASDVRRDYRLTTNMGSQRMLRCNKNTLPDPLRFT